MKVIDFAVDTPQLENIVNDTFTIFIFKNIHKIRWLDDQIRIFDFIGMDNVFVECPIEYRKNLRMLDKRIKFYNSIIANEK